VGPDSRFCPGRHQQPEISKGDKLALENADSRPGPDLMVNELTRTFSIESERYSPWNEDGNLLRYICDPNSLLDALTQIARISNLNPSSPREIRTKTHWLTSPSRKSLDLRGFMRWAFCLLSA
jgi:hypothetical protein